MNFNRFIRPIQMRRDLHSLFEQCFEKHLQARAVVYDIGCGQKPFKDFLAGKVQKHIGVDLADGFYNPDQVDLIGTAYDVPAADGVADAVILSQVIEHLESPMLAMGEAHRLLRNGGLVFLSFPFLYPIHAPPRDFLRYTEFYLADQLTSHGLEVVETVRLGGFWYLTGMNAMMYLHDVDRGPVRATRILKLLALLAGMACGALHAVEGTFLRAAGKDITGIRAKWTMNYLTVLRKTAPVN